MCETCSRIAAAIPMAEIEVVVDGHVTVCAERLPLPCLSAMTPEAARREAARIDRHEAREARRESRRVMDRIALRPAPPKPEPARPALTPEQQTFRAVAVAVAFSLLVLFFAMALGSDNLPPSPNTAGSWSD